MNKVYLRMVLEHQRQLTNLVTGTDRQDFNRSECDAFLMYLAKEINEIYASCEEKRELFD